MEQWLEPLIELAVNWGYIGLFISAFIAGSLLPFSSEVVMMLLVEAGLSPLICIVIATCGNTLGGMTCFWIGRAGNPQWMRRIGVSQNRLEQAQRFLKGRGSAMAFFAFLPYIGEAIALSLGLMKSNQTVVGVSMFCGKLLRYILLYLTLDGILSL